jgi:hypothetical protein
MLGANDSRATGRAQSISQSANTLAGIRGSKRSGSRVSQTLEKLYRLLEEHAPPWYTLEHHRKIETAFGEGPAAVAKALIEVVELLEEYAPVWYTQRSHQEAQLALHALKRT